MRVVSEFRNNKVFKSRTPLSQRELAQPLDRSHVATVFSRALRPTPDAEDSSASAAHMPEW